MALSRVKNWGSELLTSSDLNAEFNSILNNPVSLISPLTAAVDMNGFELILDADADTSITSDTDDRIDFRIGGADGMFIGLAAGNTGAFVHLDPGAFTATAATDIGLLRVGNTNAVTVPAGTTAVAAGLYLEIPNWTATGTITAAATVYIEGPATEGGTNYALWVDAGNVLFDGDLAVGGDVAVNGADLTSTATTFNLLNATVTTLNFAGAATALNVGTALGTTTFAGSTIPQNSQSAAYPIVATDANKHILHPTADDNPRTFTIPANASVAFPVGTAITFVNQINTVTIAITTDTMTLAGAGTTGSRTLAANGIATALKIAATSWIISGTGLT